MRTFFNQDYCFGDYNEFYVAWCYLYDENVNCNLCSKCPCKCMQKCQCNCKCKKIQKIKWFENDTILETIDKKYFRISYQSHKNGNLCSRFLTFCSNIFIIFTIILTLYQWFYDIVTIINTLPLKNAGNSVLCFGLIVINSGNFKNSIIALSMGGIHSFHIISEKNALWKNVTFYLKFCYGIMWCLYFIGFGIWFVIFYIWVVIIVGTIFGVVLEGTSVTKGGNKVYAIGVYIFVSLLIGFLVMIRWRLNNGDYSYGQALLVTIKQDHMKKYIMSLNQDYLHLIHDWDRILTLVNWLFG